MDEKKTFRAQATDALNAADECVSRFDKIAIIERAIRAAWESGYADSAEHHQDRPHCAGCPDDATCEASGREPRGAP